MAKTKEQKVKDNQKHVNKYISNNYDRINVTVPKGEKDRIKEAADKNGESVNSLINRAVFEEVARIEGKIKNVCDLV